MAEITPVAFPVVETTIVVIAVLGVREEVTAIAVVRTVREEVIAIAVARTVLVEAVVLHLEEAVVEAVLQADAAAVEEALAKKYII